MTSKVAFIGLGVMGYPMAGYISKAGHNVTVFNRTKSKAEKWISEYNGKMANTKSAIKTIRKNSRETLINKSRKSRFRNAIKKINVLIEKKNKKDALAYLPKLNSELMKISKTGIIKKRNASRNLSRITKKINTI